MARTRSSKLTLKEKARRSQAKPLTWFLALEVFCSIWLAASVFVLVQLNLQPVYGAIPASLYHKSAMIASSCLAFGFSMLTRGSFEETEILSWWPLHVLTIPTVLHFPLYRISAYAGATYGPLLTEFATSLPMVFLVFCSLVEKLRHPVLVDAISGVPWPFELTALQLCHVLFMILEHAMEQALPVLLQLHPMLTRSSALVAVGILSIPFTKQKGFAVIFAIPTMMYTLQLNPHMPFPWLEPKLQATLRQSQYSMLARRESVTGYVSVLENLKDEFRVMRCDHSLLGGEWLATAGRVQDNITVAEPIYSVFTMLEAVRLIRADDSATQQTTAGSALVVGLGVGTSAKAFAEHGLSTTAVEIDPAVVEYAKTYFALPPEVTTITEDALAFAQRLEGSSARYDYIVHDVFTGGAEPASLFTQEFLTSLKQLLASDGSIAINYAGDLKLGSTAMVLKTIASVFSNCRAYRDHEANDLKEVDFVNLVIFCAKHGRTWHFRDALEADFLNSQTRRENLPPKFEIAWPRLEQIYSQSEVLFRNETYKLSAFHRTSAPEHWRIMRKVLPDAVWENW